MGENSRLRDAANYILDLPTETIGLPDWQLATFARLRKRTDDPGPARVPKGAEQ